MATDADPLDASLLLDELDDDGGDVGATLPLALDGDDPELLLADLLLSDASPTAQFSLFFAADDDAFSAATRLATTEEHTKEQTEEWVEGHTEEHIEDRTKDRVENEAPPAKATRKRRAPRPAAYNSNRARNERRHEIAYLRRKVVEMETELALVQRRGRATPSPSVLVASGGRPSSSHKSTRQLHLPPGVWQEVARRQQDERRRAETENERLRRALETQLQVARSLEVVLNRKAVIRGLADCGLPVVNNRVISHTADVADRALLQGLLQHVELIYAQADQLLDGAPTDRDRTGVRTAQSGSLVEVFATDLMPFPLDAASEAAWAYFSYKKNQLPVPSRLYYERHDVENASIEDTVLESSGMERIANGVTAVIRLKQVLRRYVERDRVVIAWSALSQPVEFAGLPFSGYDLREWGCMVLRPSGPDDKRVEASRPLTVLTSCYFITPEFQGEAEGGGASYDIGRLTECLLGFTVARMTTWRQRIENILLDDQLLASRPTTTAI